MWHSDKLCWACVIGKGVQDSILNIIQVVTYHAFLMHVYNVDLIYRRSGNKCLLKVAHMCATMQDFSKAASVFEDVSKISFLLL